MGEYMMTQPDDEIEAVVRIDRVAEVFEIWPAGEFPLAKFKVKVLQREGAQFLGVPNIAIKSPVTGEPEWTSGLGDSIEEALDDALRYFFREVQDSCYDRPLTEDDFCWASSEDF